MGWMRIAAVMVLLGLSVVTDLAAGEDKLAGVREQVRKDDDDDASPPHRRRTRARRHSERDHGPGIFVSLVGPPVFYTLASPFLVPHALIEGDSPTDVDFPEFPYECSLPGYLIISSPLTPEADGWGARYELDYGTNFDDLQRMGGRLLWEHRSRFGLDAEFNDYIERTRRGNDSLWTGDGNIIYRFAQGEKIEFYSGVGLNWLTDERRTDLGFNFTYGFTAYPARPWVLEASLDAGSLGRAGRFHIRGTAGFTWKTLEFFTGYDYQRIGSVDLHGPLAGVRLWF
nr:K819 [uncultured bacterium]